MSKLLKWFWSEVLQIFWFLRCSFSHFLSSFKIFCLKHRFWTLCKHCSKGKIYVHVFRVDLWIQMELFPNSCYRSQRRWGQSCLLSGNINIQILEDKQQSNITYFIKFVEMWDFRMKTTRLKVRNSFASQKQSKFVLLKKNSMKTSFWKTRKHNYWNVSIFYLTQPSFLSIKGT